MNETELETLDEVERGLIERGVILEEIKDARDRPAFNLLFRWAKEQAIAARNDWVAADPNDAGEMRRLQNDVKRYEEMAEVIRQVFIQAVQTVQQLDALLGTASEDTEADAD